MHPFNRITECHSVDGFFQMTIGTLVRGNVFVCETSQVSAHFYSPDSKLIGFPKRTIADNCCAAFQGHTMEDLLRSYVRMYERQRQAFRSKNHMFT